MSYLSDTQIRGLCTDSKQTSMIYPMVESCSNLPNGNKCPSYGITSYGYDVRLGDTFYVSVPGKEDSPEPVILSTSKAPGDDVDMFGAMEKVTGELTLYPGEFCLGHTVEHFRMPKDVVAVCMGKSTLARMGILVVVTPLEPGWSGHLTLEIFNMNSNPVILYPGIGVTQLNFIRSSPCETDYSKKEGKYQNQPCLPILPMLK